MATEETIIINDQENMGIVAPSISTTTTAIGNPTTESTPKTTASAAPSSSPHKRRSGVKRRHVGDDKESSGAETPRRRIFPTGDEASSLELHGIARQMGRYTDGRPRPADANICFVCGAESLTYGALVSHVKAHHPERWNSRVCCICAKRYASVQNHVDLVHRYLRNHKCEICGKCYFARCDLVRHLMSVHEKVEFRCTLCPKVCTSDGHIRDHYYMIHKSRISFKTPNGPEVASVRPLTEEEIEANPSRHRARSSGGQIVRIKVRRPSGFLPVETPPADTPESQSLLADGAPEDVEEKSGRCVAAEVWGRAISPMEKQKSLSNVAVVKSSRKKKSVDQTPLPIPDAPTIGMKDLGAKIFAPEKFRRQSSGGEAGRESVKSSAGSSSGSSPRPASGSEDLWKDSTVGVNDVDSGESTPRREELVDPYPEVFPRQFVAGVCTERKDAGTDDAALKDAASIEDAAKGAASIDYVAKEATSKNSSAVNVTSIDAAAKTTGANDAADPESEDKWALSSKLALYQCRRCGQRYGHRNLIEYHLVTKHSIPAAEVASAFERRFLCTVCDELFETEAHLADHQRSRHPGLDDCVVLDEDALFGRKKRKKKKAKSSNLLPDETAHRSTAQLLCAAVANNAVHLVTNHSSEAEASSLLPSNLPYISNRRRRRRHRHRDSTPPPPPPNDPPPPTLPPPPIAVFPDPTLAPLTPTLAPLTPANASSVAQLLASARDCLEAKEADAVLPHPISTTASLSFASLARRYREGVTYPVPCGLSAAFEGNEVKDIRDDKKLGRISRRGIFESSSAAAAAASNASEPPLDAVRSYVPDSFVCGCGSRFDELFELELHGRGCRVFVSDIRPAKIALI